MLKRTQFSVENNLVYNKTTMTLDVSSP